MSVNTFSKRTEIDLRSIQLRSILVWMAPNLSFEMLSGTIFFYRYKNSVEQMAYQTAA